MVNLHWLSRRIISRFVLRINIQTKLNSSRDSLFCLRYKTNDKNRYHPNSPGRLTMTFYIAPSYDSHYS